MTPENAVQVLVDILTKAPNIPEDRLHQLMIQNSCPHQLAHQAIQLVPIAFGRQLLAGMGITFSDLYWQLSSDGATELEAPLTSNMVFQTATEMAPPLMSKDVGKSLAVKSAEVQGVNSALHSGSNAKDLKLAPIVIFSTPPSDLGIQQAQEKIRNFLNALPTSNSQPSSKPRWKIW